MNIKSLVFVAIFVIAFLGFSTPSIVKGVTIADLLAQIAQLQAQIAQLQAQQNLTTSAAWCHTFNNGMGYGATGADYNALITALDRESIADFNSTNRPEQYDEIIGGAVVRFQAKYGIVPQSGYVGPLTRAKLNQLYGCSQRAVASESEPVQTIFVTQPTTANFSAEAMNYGWLPISGDWNGDGKDTVGLYDPRTSIFHLRNSNNQGNADITFPFGAPNAEWIPIAGDWNNDGIDTVGLYDPTTSIFHLKNINGSNGVGGGNADITFPFGSAGANWVPIAGDWNGDGVDSVGLYDPASSHFYLKNINGSNGIGGGNADISFGYGAINTVWPTAGDWNNDGTDTIGLYNPMTAIFSLRNTNNSGVADITFAFGSLNNKWFPIAGQWRDGVSNRAEDTIGLFDPASSHFYLRNTNTTGNSDISFGFGAATVVPPSITITSPNGGVTFNPGQQATVSYTASNFPRPISVQLQLNKGADYVGNGGFNPVGNATAYVPATGSYVFTIPSNAVSGNDYSFMIGSDYPSTETSGLFHSNNFTITAPSAQPTITVTSPNGGESWQIGTTHRIAWNSQGISSVYIYIDNYSSGGGTLGTPSVPISQGYYDWTISSQQLGTMLNAADQSKYKIRVVDAATNSAVSPISDSSDNYFTITAPIVSPVACNTFTYSAWSGCIAYAAGMSGTQTRTITSMTPTGCIGGTPEPLSQSCTVANCAPIWQYGTWSTCVGGMQTRTKTNGNRNSACATPGAVLIEEQSCTVAPASNSTWLPISGKWLLGATKDTIGLYDPATSQFYLRTTNTTGVADISFGFGSAGAGWLPIAGDWNNDGVDTIGLYNPATSTFYLRNSNSTGNADITFGFGAAGAGWLPIAGNWDGVGGDSIGLYNPATAQFYLRNSNTTGNADISFGFGAANWKPVAGDWNGDGVSTIGAYDPSASQFYLKNYNTTGNADISFGFGAPNWKPVMGDWDENAVSTAGLFEPSTSTFYLRNSNTTGAADTTFRYGALTLLTTQNSIASVSDAFYKILEEFRKLLTK